MKISSFKLNNKGYSGIAVKSVEPVIQGNMTILDNVTREREYPLPDELRMKIQDLKYFFLNITGHWIEPFNKYINKETYKVLEVPTDPEPPKGYFIMQDIINHSTITGITVKNSGFCIMGEIEVVEGKKMGLTTPFITEEDDLSFFIEAMDRINVLMDDIAGVLTSTKALPFNASSVLNSIGVKSENTKDLTNEEMTDMVIERLYEKGAIILINDDGSENKLTEGTKTKLHTGTGSIDSHNVTAAVEHNEDNEDKKEDIGSQDDTGSPDKIDKKDIGKGTLASEKNFPKLDDEGKVIGPGSDNEDNPDGGSLEQYEHSENLGIPEENTGIEEDVNNNDEAKTEGQW